MNRHVEAVLALLVFGWLLLYGDPFLKRIDPADYDSEAEWSAFAERWGGLTPGMRALVALQRLKLPVYTGLGFTTELFDTPQGYGVYAEGGSKQRRVEVWVDDALVYRNRDPEHTWRARYLGDARIRPLLVKTCKKADEARSWEGLARYLADRVRADFPDAQGIELVCSVAGWRREDFTARRWLHIEPDGSATWREADRWTR